MVGFKPATTSLGFINGLVLQFINPKAYVVGATLFSGFAFMPEAPVAEVVVKLLLFNAIWVPVHLIWLGAGVNIWEMLQLGYSYAAVLIKIIFFFIYINIGGRPKFRK